MTEWATIINVSIGVLNLLGMVYFYFHKKKTDEDKQEAAEMKKTIDEMKANQNQMNIKISGMDEVVGFARDLISSMITKEH